MASWYQAQRLEAVLRVVLESGARTVLDLGCGDGDLLLRLADQSRLERIVGIDIAADALERARIRLSEHCQRVELVHESMTETGTTFCGFDCAVLLETIEHMEPGRLSVLERALFVSMRPDTVVITTPNAELNDFLDVPPGRFRHPDHRFEWDRERFAHWAEGVARRNDFQVDCSTLAGHHPRHGGATQMAVFHRLQPEESKAP